MKWLGWTSIACVLWASCLVSFGRELTSADGSKKIEAEFVRYSFHTNMVTLRLASGKRMVVEANKFSQEDQEYFSKMARAKAIEGAVDVHFRSRPKDNFQAKSGKGQVTITKRRFEHAFILENTSEHPLKDLTLKYWIVLQKFDDKNDEIHEIQDGELAIDKLPPGEKVEVAGPEIILIQGAFSTCKPDCRDCWKNSQAAALILEEEVFGHKVELINAAGDVVVSDCSSSRVRDLLDKK